MTIILGAIPIDINSWNNSLHAYGMRTCDICVLFFNQLIIELENTIKFFLQL